MSDNFLGFSKDIVESFLSSVLIIDEEAQYEEEEIDIPSKVDEPEIRPGTIIEEEEKVEDKKDLKDSTHKLFMKEIISSFAKKNILCSYIKPDENYIENFTVETRKFLNCTDIIILDWKISDKPGDEVVSFINSIKQDNDLGLRLLVIYSAENPNRIKKDLENKCSLEEIDKGHPYTLKMADSQIVIFSKPDTHFDEAGISYEDLPEKTILEFTRMAMGLVSNVVLFSLHKLRTNTYRILKRFARNVDEAYLSNRLLLNSPQDSERLLEHLIVGEFSGLVEEANTGEKAGIEAIKKWISDLEKTDYKIIDKSYTPEEINQILEVGLDKFIDEICSEDKKIKKGKAHRENLSKNLFSGDKNSEQKFAYLTNTRAKYENSMPFLTSGSIIKSKTDNYFICVEPKCGTVNLTNKKRFAFLELSETQKPDEKFNLVLGKDENSFINLNYKTKSDSLKMLCFSPDIDQRRIIAILDSDNEFIFNDEKDENYYWICDLRMEFSQRINNELAASLSRVGVLESEWLRLWAK